jgi:hypothetical protein
MKKAAVLKALPTLKALRKTLKADQAQLGRLNEKVLDTESLINELQDVEIYNNFPVAVSETEGGLSTEVYAACDEVSRYAVVSAMAGGSDRYRVTGYKTDAELDGNQLAEDLPKSKAITAAKDYVSTGRVGGKPRGRKPGTKVKDAIKTKRTVKAKTKA